MCSAYPKTNGSNNISSSFENVCTHHTTAHSLMLYSRNVWLDMCTHPMCTISREHYCIRCCLCMRRLAFLSLLFRDGEGTKLKNKVKIKIWKQKCNQIPHCPCVVDQYFTFCVQSHRDEPLLQLKPNMLLHIVWLEHVPFMLSLFTCLKEIYI